VIQVSEGAVAVTAHSTSILGELEPQTVPVA